MSWSCATKKKTQKKPEKDTKIYLGNKVVLMPAGTVTRSSHLITSRAAYIIRPIWLETGIYLFVWRQGAPLSLFRLVNNSIKMPSVALLCINNRSNKGGTGRSRCAQVQWRHRWWKYTHQMSNATLPLNECVALEAWKCHPVWRGFYFRVPVAVHW